MQEIMNVNVKMTLKDLKEYCFALSMSGFNKVFLIIGIILCVLLTMTVALFAILTRNIWNMIPTTILLIFVIAGFNLLPTVIMYLVHRSSYNKSKLAKELQSYCFFDDRLEISSESGKFILSWKDVYRIQEYRPCFAIQSAPGKTFLIPRRCFESQEHLDVFLNIMRSQSNVTRLRLKGYRLKNSNPDYGEILCKESYGQAVESENEQGEPVLQIEFSLQLSDYLRFSFRHYYTKPKGLILTAIGVLLLAALIRGLILGIGVLFFPLVFGILLTVLMPLMIYYNSIKAYKKDAAIQESYIFMFFEHYFILRHIKGVSRIKYTDLLRVTERKTAIFLYLSNELAYIIPKGAFDSEEDKLIALRDLLKL